MTQLVCPSVPLYCRYVYLALLPYILSNFDDDNVGVNITTTITIVTWTESSLSFSEEEEEEEGWSFKPCLDATMVTSSVSTSTTSNKALSKFGRRCNGSSSNVNSQ